MDFYDYGARFYDAVVPHFTTIDPRAEQFPWQSPYCYAANNPIRFIDKNGENAIIPPGMDFVANSYLNAYTSSVKTFVKRAGGNEKEQNFATKHLYTAYVSGSPYGSGTAAISYNFGNNAKNGLNSITGTKVYNALRHSLWHALTAQKVGSKISIKMGIAHEKDENITKGDPDTHVDLKNNEIGAKLGEANPEANPHELALMIVIQFSEGGMFQAKTINGVEVGVEKSNLTMKQLQIIVNNIIQLNENGRTDEQQKKQDESNNDIY